MHEIARSERGRFTKGRSGNPRGRTPGVPNRPKHLPIDDAVKVAQLATRGFSPRKIAKEMNARPSAVKEALAGALRLLQVFAPQFAMDWITASGVAAARGDHRPAMDALLSIGVIKPIPQTYQTGANEATPAVSVQLVGFSFAGLPPAASAATDAPADIDVEPSRCSVDS